MPSANAVTIDLTLSDDETPQNVQNVQRNRRGQRAIYGQEKSQSSQRHLSRPEDRASSRANSDQPGRSATINSSVRQQHGSRAGPSTDLPQHRDTARSLSHGGPRHGVNASVSKTRGSSPRSAGATKSKADGRDSEANERPPPSNSSMPSNSEKTDASSRGDPSNISVMPEGLKKTDSGSHERDTKDLDLPPARTARGVTRRDMATPTGMKRHREGETIQETPAAKKPRTETHPQHDGPQLSSVTTGLTRIRRPAIVPGTNADHATAQQKTASQETIAPKTPPRRPAASVRLDAERTSPRDRSRSDVIILDDDPSNAQQVDLSQQLHSSRRKPLKQSVVVDLSNDDDGEEAASTAQDSRSGMRPATTPKRHLRSPNTASSQGKPSKATNKSSSSRISHVARNEREAKSEPIVQIEDSAEHVPSESAHAPSTGTAQQRRRLPHDSPMALDASDHGSESGKGRSQQALVERADHQTSKAPIVSSPPRSAAQDSLNAGGSGDDRQKAAEIAASTESAPRSTEQETVKSAVSHKAPEERSAQVTSLTVEKSPGNAGAAPPSRSTARGISSDMVQPATVNNSQRSSAGEASAAIETIRAEVAEPVSTTINGAVSTMGQRTPQRQARQHPEPRSLGSSSTCLHDMPNAQEAASIPHAQVKISESASVTSGSNAIVSSPKKPFTQLIQASTETLAQTVERTVGAELSNYAADNEYYHRVELKLARLSKKVQQPGERPARDQHQDGVQVEKPYSFKSWAPLALEPRTKGANTSKATLLDIERVGRPGKTKVAVPYLALQPLDNMPAYAHYVSIKENFLAPNSRNLHYWPYFTDDFDYEKRGESLRAQYDLDIKPRKRKLARLQRAESLEAYAEQALKKLDLDWSDVLCFLLDPQPNIGEGNADALRALAERDVICSEDFKRGDERAQTVLSCLPAPKPERVGRAAILCERFSKMANISLWQIARKHLLDALPKDSEKDRAPFWDAFTCRVCMRFDCPYHGQIDEYEDEYDELDDMPTEQRKDDPVITDIIHPRKVNYRTRTDFNPSAPETSDAQSGPTTLKKRGLEYWQKFVYDHVEQDVFQPCHHPGLACDQAACSCYDRRSPCEKTCSCSTDCPRRFPGCNCKQNGKKVCFEDERCLCSALSRECDPDLCGTCGVIDVVDPVNRYNEEICKGKCKNAGIQRGVPKRTMIGDSAIHGFGLYIGEEVGPDEFIGEYKGEVIMKEEAERRGAVYEFQGLSYLFTLNKTQEIDSTYFGNKIRFINHADWGRNNTYPRVRLVNAVHHIALYSRHRLKSGEELFFDYGPKFGSEALGGVAVGANGKKKRTSRAKVRDSNLVLAQEYEVEHDFDERGNRRAVKGVKKGRASSVRKGLGESASSKRAEEEGVEDEVMRDVDGGDADVEEPEGAGGRLKAYYIDGSNEAEAEVVEGEGEDEDDAYVDKSDEEDEEDDENSSDREEEPPSSSSSPPRPRRSGRGIVRR